MSYYVDLATPYQQGIKKREEEASHDIFHSIARMVGGGLVGLLSGGPAGMAAGAAASLVSDITGNADMGAVAGHFVGGALAKRSARHDMTEITGAPKIPGMQDHTEPLKMLGPERPMYGPTNPDLDPTNRYREQLRNRWFGGGS